DRDRPGAGWRKLGETTAIAGEGAGIGRTDAASTSVRTGDAGRLRQRGGDVRARAFAPLGIAFGEQLLVRQQDHIARHAELERQRTRGRQPRRRRHLAGEDRAPEPLVDLLAERGAAFELQEHGPVPPKWYHENPEEWLFAGSTILILSGERSAAP